MEEFEVREIHVSNRSFTTIWLLVCLVASSGCGTGPAEHGAGDSGAGAEGVGAVATAPQSLLPNGKQPEEGLLVGGQPTLEQLETARDLGYRTAINLRRVEEPGAARAEVEGLGMDYVSIPVAGAEGVTEANARSLAAALEEAEKPVIVYCGSGNRVGALFALKAFHVDGESPEAALQVGRDHGMTRLEPVVREQLGILGEPN